MERERTLHMFHESRFGVSIMVFHTDRLFETHLRKSRQQFNPIMIKNPSLLRGPLSFHGVDDVSVTAGTQETRSAIIAPNTWLRRRRAVAADEGSSV